jgi:hypothetical protein
MHGSYKQQMKSATTQNFLVATVSTTNETKVINMSKNINARRLQVIESWKLKPLLTLEGI